MTNEEAKYKRMTETPVSKLILTLAVPTIISMMITTIYNTADTFFVSKISVAASGATGIVFSLMAVLQAFGFMLGHGAGSNISRLLGARKVDHASVFLSTSFFLALLVGLLIGVLGLVFLEPFMLLLGSTATILPEAKAYGTFILLAAPAMVASCVMNNVLGTSVRAMGDGDIPSQNWLCDAVMEMKGWQQRSPSISVLSFFCSPFCGVKP